MEKTLLFLAVCAFTTLSCSERAQNLSPNPSNLSSYSVRSGRLQAQRTRVSMLSGIPKVPMTAPLKVVLTTLNGSAVANVSELKSNTVYQVEVTGAREIQVRSCLGCDLVDETDRFVNQKPVHTFKIKTNQDVLESPVISVIPLRYVRGEMAREQAQMIPLVKSSTN